MKWTLQLFHLASKGDAEVIYRHWDLKNVKLLLVFFFQEKKIVSKYFRKVIWTHNLQQDINILNGFLVDTKFVKGGTVQISLNQRIACGIPVSHLTR